MNYLQATAAIPAALLIALLSGCPQRDQATWARIWPSNVLRRTPRNRPPVTACAAEWKVPQDPGPAISGFAAPGEVLASRLRLPPASDSDAAFVDGWDVKFTRLLTTIDKIQLSRTRTKKRGTAVTGPLVAEVDGPWAVDLSHSDPSYLPGKGGSGEQAVPIAALNSQNRNGGSSFATDGTRYAFGFDVIAATDQAQNVNLDADALADYQDMVTSGCAVLYVGTATFKGDPKFDGCVTEASKALPATVSFHLCFKSPTSYLNCQNPDNDRLTDRSAEEHQRGIAFLSNSSVIGQVTMHTDHPFWDSVLHDSPAHFGISSPLAPWSAARAPR